MKFTLKPTFKRGSALISVIIFGAVVSVCAGFAFRATMFQTRMADRSVDYMAAMAVAEAGAELAMVELNKSSEASPKPFTSWSGTTVKTYTETVRDSENNVVGETTVEVGGTGSKTPTVTATGYIPNKGNARIVRTVQLTTENNTVPSPFGSFGVFGYDRVNLTGSGDIKSNVGTLGNITMTGSADITGNMQAGGHISATGSGDVSGDVEYGDNYDHSGSGKVKGTKTRGSAPTPPPAIVAPDFDPTPPHSNVNQHILYDGKAANVPARGTAEMTGSKDMTLAAAGNYDLRSLRHTGSGDLRITAKGDVTIYCQDTFNITGSGNIIIGDETNLTIYTKTLNMVGSKELKFYGDGNINLVAKDLNMTGSGDLELYGDSKMIIHTQNFSKTGSGDLNAVGNKNPSQLQIFATGNTSFTGSGNTYAGLYAPNARFSLTGSGDWYGAIIGKSVERTGSGKITAYNQLLEPTGGDGSLVTSWLEVDPK